MKSGCDRSIAEERMNDLLAFTYETNIPGKRNAAAEGASGMNANAESALISREMMNALLPPRKAITFAFSFALR